ncbi:hypothetical protein C8Q74DRAFT_346397 [Fomes fomentarius]|nr:hypothetical protein C8Q74DRAFT_346397 [Fomes fomentarius]
MRVRTNGTADSQYCASEKVTTAAMGPAPYPTTRPVQKAARRYKQASSDVSTLPDSVLLAPEHPCPPLMRHTSSSRSSQRSNFTDHGLPTREEFAKLEEQYLASLDKSKKAKALVSQEMFDKIWLVLHFPDDCTIGTPQFRWWVRKMFALAHPDQLEDATLRTLQSSPSDGHVQVVMRECGTQNAAQQPRFFLSVVVHDGKRLAIREHIYDIICVCHERIGHGGRDRTSAEIRKIYTWVPKDLILLFIKHCPTCVAKKNGKSDDSRVEGTGTTPLLDANPPDSCSGALSMDLKRPCPPLGAGSVNQSTGNLMADSHSGMAPPSTSQLLYTINNDGAALPPPMVYDPGVSEDRLRTVAHNTWTTSTPEPGLVPSGSGAPTWRFSPDAEGHSFTSSEGVPSVPHPSYLLLPDIHFDSEGVVSNRPAQPHAKPLQMIQNNPAPGVGAGHMHGHDHGPSTPNLHAPQPRTLLPPPMSAALGQGMGGPHASSDESMGKIDPALLPDGVHMLALAAEMSQARETGRSSAVDHEGVRRT